MARSISFHCKKPFLPPSNSPCLKRVATHQVVFPTPGPEILETTDASVHVASEAGDELDGDGDPGGGEDSDQGPTQTLGVGQILREGVGEQLVHLGHGHRHGEVAAVVLDEGDETRSRVTKKLELGTICLRQVSELSDDCHHESDLG